MNLNQILNMVIRTIMRRGINAGINRGIDMASGRGKASRNRQQDDRDGADDTDRNA